MVISIPSTVFHTDKMYNIKWLSLQPPPCCCCCCCWRQSSLCSPRYPEILSCRASWPQTQRWLPSAEIKGVHDHSCHNPHFKDENIGTQSGCGLCKSIEQDWTLHRHRAVTGWEGTYGPGRNTRRCVWEAHIFLGEEARVYCSHNVHSWPTTLCELLQTAWLKARRPSSHR